MTSSTPILNITMNSKRPQCPTAKVLAMEPTDGQSKQKHTIDGTDMTVSKRHRPNTNSTLPNRDTSPNGDVLEDERADTHDGVIDMTGVNAESDIDKPQNSEGELGRIYVLQCISTDQFNRVADGGMDLTHLYILFAGSRDCVHQWPSSTQIQVSWKWLQAEGSVVS